MIRPLGSLVLVLALTPTAVAGDVPGSVRVDTSGAPPPGVVVAGTIERVVTWRDAAGEHAAVFASLTSDGVKDGAAWWSKTLTVTTYDRKGAAYRRAREVKEVVPPCALDLTARFLEATIGVTDLDGNGHGELTFAYVTRCAGDVSPLSMKLLVLERTRRWILRGQTRVDLGDGQVVGGDYKADLTKAPPAIEQHAAAVWEANATVW